MKIGHLRCEQLCEPLSMDAPAPRLSWRMASARRGARQTAYRILVASSREGLARGAADIWDSGRVPDARSVLIPYAGARLAPRATYWWKIRVWDEADHVSPWSPPASWTTGMMGSAWPGDYIAMDRSAGDPEHPLLRTTFNLARTPVSARAYLNALGYVELHVNGGRVGDAPLMPGPSQYDRRSLYLVQDVTDRLRAGENVFGIALGRGGYVHPLPGVAHDGPVIRGFIEVAYRDGSTEQIVTDARWKAQAGPVTRIGIGICGRYGGERIDARRENPGWSDAGFDDTGWSPVCRPDIPPHAVSAMCCEPNRIVRTFRPRRIRRLAEEQAWLVDFGTNLTGLFRIRFDRLSPGQGVEFEFADGLSPDGAWQTYAQNSAYIGRGEAGEAFENRFNYHAFRYVLIRGLAEAPDPAAMQAALVRTGYPVQATFTSSNRLLNRIHSMVRHTLECLTLGGIQVDCPHRERMGYGGDGLSSTPSAMTMHGMGPLYTQWMMHWRDVQRPDGGLPHTAPSPHKRGGGPYWCSFIIGAPWQAYLQYGDRGILETNYPAMQQWFDRYVAAHRARDGLLWGWPDVPYRNWYLGDWGRPGRKEKGAGQSVHLVTNCMLIECAEHLEQIARVLERPADAARYRREAAGLRRAVHAAFHDAEGPTYANDTQLDLAYPLLVDAVPGRIKGRILQRLEDKILVEHAGHLDVGLVGVPVLTAALEKLGRHDLVFSYTSQRTFPGWGYMVRRGATTTWEFWDGEASHIHNCYNGIGQWFYTGLAGIVPKADAPGYKEFVLCPRPIGGLTRVAARKDTPYGRIESRWHTDNAGGFHWTLRVPPNTTADVRLPAVDADEVWESGRPLHLALPGHPLRMEEGRVALRLESGRYRFHVHPARSRRAREAGREKAIGR